MILGLVVLVFALVLAIFGFNIQGESPAVSDELNCGELYPNMPQFYMDDMVCPADVAPEKLPECCLILTEVIRQEYEYIGVEFLAIFCLALVLFVLGALVFKAQKDDQEFASAAAEWIIFILMLLLVAFLLYGVFVIYAGDGCAAKGDGQAVPVEYGSIEGGDDVYEQDKAED